MQLPDFYPNWIVDNFNHFERNFLEFVQQNTFINEFPGKEVFYDSVFPGRRTRPVLLLAFYKTSQKAFTTDILNIAFSVELFHRAAILVDDILDEEDKRRSLPVIYKKYGVKKAILISNLLLALGIENLSKIRNSKIHLSNWDNRFKEAIRGEYQDITSEIDGQLYSEIVKKTTSFFEFISDVINIEVKNINEKDVSLIFRLLGEAFQISNDIHDFQNSQERLLNLKEISFSGNYVFHKLNYINQAANKESKHIEKAPPVNAYLEEEINTRIIQISCLNVTPEMKFYAIDYLKLLLHNKYWSHDY